MPKFWKSKKFWKHTAIGAGAVATGGAGSVFIFGPKIVQEVTGTTELVQLIWAVMGAQ